MLLVWLLMVIELCLFFLFFWLLLLVIDWNSLVMFVVLVQFIWISFWCSGVNLVICFCVFSFWCLWVVILLVGVISSMLLSLCLFRFLVFSIRFSVWFYGMFCRCRVILFCMVFEVIRFRLVKLVISCSIECMLMFWKFSDSFLLVQVKLFFLCCLVFFVVIGLMLMVR